MSVNQPVKKDLATSDNLKSILSAKSVIAQFERALPSHMSADRMTRIAITAASKTPGLNKCTIESVMKCLLDLSAMGLEPDGRHAHLIPYGKECTLIVDYKGLVALAYRSGDVKSIHADVVYEGDIFSYRLGKVVDHQPYDFIFGGKAESKGNVIAAYCIVELKDGAEKHEVMTLPDLEGIRARSKAGSKGPWKTDTNEMYKKTVFRRASKWIPMSSDLRDHFDRDFDSLPPLKQVRVSSLNNLVHEKGDQPLVEAKARVEQEVAVDSDPNPPSENHCRDMIRQAGDVDALDEIVRSLHDQGADHGMVSALAQEQLEAFA